MNTQGWRSPRGLYLDDPLEGFGLSAEDSAARHAIMMVGSRERLEFLAWVAARGAANLPLTSDERGKPQVDRWGLWN
jgi:hypothetical protein